MSDWYQDEAELLSWRRELQRLKRRARTRLGTTLLLTTIMTGLVVFYMARRQPLAQSRVLIRVTEGSLMREDSPLTTGDLAAYLHDSAFTGDNLARIARQHKPFPGLDADDPAVVEMMKWHLDLDVYRNYFMVQRGYNADVRTARVAVTFWHDDPAMSLEIARALAELIIATENQRRTSHSDDLSDLTNTALVKAYAQLAMTQDRIATGRLALDAARTDGDESAVAVLKMELGALYKVEARQKKVVTEIRESQRRAELQAALDASGMGIQYQIVDERPPPPPLPQREQIIRLAMFGIACFVILLPLCAIGLGAFDTRLHDRDDVQRLGLAVVGHVPRFRGHRIGSMRQRMDRMSVRRRRRRPDVS